MSTLRHADPYALYLRRRLLERELAAIAEEERRRAVECPPGLVREAPPWTPEKASTLTPLHRQR